jgi:hypothetical protein
MRGGQTSRLIHPNNDRYTLQPKFSAEDEPAVAMYERHERADQSAISVENADEEDRRHGNDCRSGLAPIEGRAVISGCVARSRSGTSSARFLQSSGGFDYSPFGTSSCSHTPVSTVSKLHNTARVIHTNRVTAIAAK